MKFPGSITGPQFDDGDLVSFTFEDAELTLRLPVVAYDVHSIDEVSVEHDFTASETWRWEEYMQHRQKEIVVQKWKYEDDFTHDDIATVYMSIIVIAHKDTDERGHYLLNSETFKRYWLDAIEEDGSDCTVKSVDKLLIDGLHLMVDPGDGVGRPTPIALFSLGRHFSLQVIFNFDSLHYTDRKNPYSDELLHEWAVELFNDFLSHIDIEYTPETVAAIEKISSDR